MLFKSKLNLKKNFPVYFSSSFSLVCNWLNNKRILVDVFNGDYDSRTTSFPPWRLNDISDWSSIRRGNPNLLVSWTPIFPPWWLNDITTRGYNRNRTTIWRGNPNFLVSWIPIFPPWWLNDITTRGYNRNRTTVWRRNPNFLVCSWISSFPPWWLNNLRRFSNGTSIRNPHPVISRKCIILPWRLNYRSRPTVFPPQRLNNVSHRAVVWYWMWNPNSFISRTFQLQPWW